MKRIGSNATLKGYVIVNSEGTILRTDMESQQATKVSQDLRELSELSKSGVRDLDPESNLAFIRLRTKKVEYMIAPDPEFTLIVVQHVEQSA